jgi:hypothetical protein
LELAIVRVKTLVKLVNSILKGGVSAHQLAIDAHQPKSYQAKCIALDALPNPSKSGKFSSLCEGGLTTKGYPEGKTPSGLISPRGNV